MSSTCRSVELRGERYTVGDHVLLRGTKTELICRLTGFSRNTTDDQATAEVHWLYWPQEMAAQLRSVPSKKRPQLPEHTPSEVFTSDSTDTISVGTIQSKVSVTHLPHFQPVPPQSPRGRPRRYYARWHWNSSSRKFIPVSGVSEMKGLLGAVIRLSSPHPTPTSSSSAQETTSQKLTPRPTPRSVSSRGKCRTKEISIYLSRSPSVSSPSEKRTVAPPPTSPQSLPLLTPRSISMSRAAAARAKSYPQKPVSTGRIPTSPKSARSARDRLVDILTYGGGLTEETDELPLPPSSAKSPRNKERGRQSQKGRQERKAQTTPKRDSQLNTSDVVDLLVVDDEKEEEVGDLEQCEHDDLNSDNMAAATGKKRKGVREKGKRGTGRQNGHASETESKEKGGAERKRNEEKATKSGRKAGGKEVSRGGRDRGKARSTRNGNGEGGENVPEDIVTSQQGVLRRGDVLTTPSAGRGKWSLRARSAVRPPAYLATDLGRGSELSRKRDRSPTRLLDILISEPEMKKMKHMAASWGEDVEDRDDRGVREAVTKIPDNRARLTRTHTLPRTRDPSGAASARLGEPSVGSTATPNHHHRVKPQKIKKEGVGGELRKTVVSKKAGGDTGKSSKEQKVSSAEPLRKRKRLLGAIDWDSISEESEVSDSGSGEEYELGSEEAGSESEMEDEEEEGEAEEEEAEEEEAEEEVEEEEVEEPINPPASSRKESIQSCSVDNWSPEPSPLVETTPVALPRKRGRPPKNRPQTISKTPSGRTPAGSTPGHPTQTTPVALPRKRGRPPKNRPQTISKTPSGRTPAGSTPGHPTQTTPAASSRKSGRPPKNRPQTISKTPSYSPPTQTTPARKRGRPPKNRPQTISKIPGDRTSTPGRGVTPGSKTAASKTPGGRTPAGHKSPASRSATGRTPRVMPTPNLPQKKKPAAGGAERTDFDKVRQR